MSLRYHTSGNPRSWQTRPSDHLAGNRRWVHGPIRPMEQPSLWARLFGRGR
jgi:hypothetical protein